MKSRLTIKGVSAALLIASAMALTTGIPASAERAAASDADDFQFQFTYSDEELSDPQSAAKLVERLRHYVEKQCSASVTGTRVTRREFKACVSDSMDKAIGNIGSRAVTEAYTARVEG